MRRKKYVFELSRAGVVFLTMAAVFCVWRGCSPKKRHRVPPLEPPVGEGPFVLVTGYCNCGQCCGWKRSWFGFGPPVYTYGSMKGKPKKVGQTARGTAARWGTVAADPKVFPFGTRLDIPGYGTGVVEDVGGAIKGRHIDVWFPSHDEALQWGRREVDVKTIK